MGTTEGESTTAVVDSSAMVAPRRTAAPTPATPTFDPGQNLGRYRLDRVLGRGGMGVVYAAFDPELDRPVALKVLRPDGPGGGSVGDQARLLREAQAMASLSHPNVIAVYDVGRIDDQVYIAMELVDGIDLARWLGEGSTPWHRALEVMLQAGRGLADAHAHGIVHRDFKPANVLIGHDGRVRVVDFGLARSLGITGSLSSSGIEPPTDERSDVDTSSATGSRSHELPALTEAGAVMGTPAYMAPEQAAGETIDARTDQFSYCVTLYEVLYGERPFDGSDRRQQTRNARLGKIRPAPARSGVPAQLRKAVLRGLRPDPDARFPDMPSLLAALDRDRGRRKKLGAWLGLAAIVAAVGVVTSPEPPAGCDGTNEELAAIWSPARRAALAEAFTATSTTYAGETWSRVSTALDDYAAQWTTARTDLCRATGVAPAIADLRQACLYQRRAEFSALVEIFAQPDDAVVQRAVETTGRLQSPASCSALVEEPVGVAAPPSSIAADVQGLREDLSSLVIFRDTGRFERALTLGERVLARATELGYEPLLAEALYRQAKTEEAIARHVEARSRLQEAYYLASQCGHDEIAAQAAMDLVFEYGYRSSEPGTSEIWRGHAEAAIRRVSPSQRATLEARGTQVAGSVALRQGDFARADELLGRAYASTVAAKGAEDMQVASILINRSVAQLELGDHEGSRQTLLHALSIVESHVGSVHPDVASVYENLGVTAQRQGRHDLSLEYFKQAYEIETAVFGPSHVHLAMTLNNIGSALALLHRNEQAKDYFERSIALYETSSESDPVDVARPIGNLGRTLHYLGDPQAGIQHLHRAVELLEATAGPEHPELSPLLFNLGMAYDATGDHDQALVHLGRTLELERKVFGMRHPFVGSTLTTIAEIRLGRGENAAATSLLEESLDIQRSGDGDPGNLAGTLYSLARALWGDPRQRARASALLDEAERIYAERGEATADALDTLRRWRRDHPGA